MGSPPKAKVFSRVTVTGLRTSVSPELLDAAGVFGQINVSIDGLGDAYAEVRGRDGFAIADDAVARMRARGLRVGLNVVLTRGTFDRLGAVVEYARRRGIREVEILRYKPVGRAREGYPDLALTPEQAVRLLPVVLGLARRHRVRLRLDCSMAPFVCAHDPDPELLSFLGITGCLAGDHLVAADSAGRVSGCSFLAPEGALGSMDRLSEAWDRPGAFAATRSYVDDAPEPCRSCRYLAICRGGCRAVAVAAGNPGGPDPECPRVLSRRRAG